MWRLSAIGLTVLALCMAPERALGQGLPPTSELPGGWDADPHSWSLPCSPLAVQTDDASATMTQIMWDLDAYTCPDTGYGTGECDFDWGARGLALLSNEGAVGGVTVAVSSTPVHVEVAVTQTIPPGLPAHQAWSNEWQVTARNFSPIVDRRDADQVWICKFYYDPDEE